MVLKRKIYGKQHFKIFQERRKNCELGGGVGVAPKSL
jgi:hypothetical protein